MADLLTAKGILAWFQKDEFASGAVAIPTSPIPPERASGEILKKGTADVTTFILLSCANTVEAHAIIKARAASFKVAFFIRMYSWLWRVIPYK